MFKVSNTIVAALIAVLAMVGDASAGIPARRDIALADNPVDACNGSNHYGVGHSCAWAGGNEGTCQVNPSGVLVCVN
ncbi:unnamed protein product [Peniophora sp. CBMAI 1063]|nr:unnamed protein product [Peniophora sp. CBMAI 1063]